MLGRGLQLKAIAFLNCFLGLLIGLKLLPLQHMIYPRPFTEFGMLVFFTNFSPMEFQVTYLVLFLLFTVIDNFGWFWSGGHHKKFLKGPVLVLHFSYYTLMTFLMMLSVILLSMLMVLLSTLSVIRYLICGNKYRWLLNLSLTYETL